jgi:hypothetical protein
MYSELTDNQKKLADFMSDISEEAYHAGWMMNLEFVLWDAAINGERKYGQHIITQAEIDSLIQFATENDCWIYFDDKTEETSIPLNQWRKKFLEDIGKYSGILSG